MLSKLSSAAVMALALSYVSVSAAPFHVAPILLQKPSVQPINNCTIGTPAWASSLHKKPSLQIVQSCTVPKTAALTFDDGVWEYEDDISKTLGNSSLASFFINGDNWGCIYSEQAQAMLRALDERGHLLGNHGWAHKDFSTLTEEEINEELWRVEEAMIRILGKRPLYFRPPYGSYNDLVVKVLEERNYTTLWLWDQDLKDGNGATVQSQKAMYDGMASAFPQSHLVLAHSVHESSALDVTPYAVKKLVKAGYELVSLDTCIGAQGECPYAYVSKPEVGNWTC